MLGAALEILGASAVGWNYHMLGDSEPEPKGAALGLWVAQDNIAA